jgi:hypothetical protein
MRRASVSLFLILLCCAAWAHAQQGSDWGKSFAAAESAFNSRAQYSSVTLFQDLIQKITQEKSKRALSEAENTLLCKSYDYLGQSYYNHGEFAPAYQAYSKLLELNPAYKLNEDLVSPKIVKFAEDIRAQLPKKAPPAPAEIKTQLVPAVQPTTVSLLIASDTSCTVNLDGKDLGAFKANDVRTIPVTQGQHLIVATAGKQTWRRVVDVKHEQVIANIELSKPPANPPVKTTNPVVPPENKTPVKPAEPEPQPVKPSEPEPQPAVSEPAVVGGGKVTLYVYRTGDVITAAPSVFMDSVELAKVGRGQYFVAEVEPGSHQFRFSGWGYVPPGRGQGTLYEGSRTLSLDPGEYYLRVFFEKNSLNLVSERMAKPDVAGCRLVDMTSVKNRDLVINPR